MIRISIVTITYNAAEVLQRTLDSVSSQTYSGIEHLIIDGASKDGTVAMAEAYRQRVSYDVIIQSEPDKGIYDAMNKGLQRATGDYIVFMNAGDTFHEPATLEKVADVAKEDVAILYGDTNIVDDEGRFLHKRHLNVPDRLTWRSFRQGMLVCHQAFYARTDVARDIPYDLQYRHSADVDWCIRVMKETERRHLTLQRVPGVVADFLDGGNTSQNHRASLKERFVVMRRHYGLPTTLTMHAWFILRAISSKLFSR